MESHPLALRFSDRGMRILRFPLTRFFIAIIFMFVFLGLARGLSIAINHNFMGEDSGLLRSAIVMVLSCTFTWSGYALYCATVEGRKVHELDRSKGLKQVGLGVLLGFGFISIVMLIMFVGGGYRVTGLRPASVMLPFLIMSVNAGIVEEIISRGVIFRIGEEGIGTWWSMLFSAAIFGFLHIMNPNATIYSSVSIALTAGVILAMLYVVTRQLWVPIGMHIGWNFALGGIYGAPVSGGEANGLLAAAFPGPEWLTGGAFGPEASVIMLPVFVVLSIFLIRKSVIDKSWIRPMWRKNHD